MKTNIGKMFIKLVRKHFPKNNKYDKIFKLNTLKLSYCCTTNVGNIIKQHSSKVLSKTNDNNNRKCNCRSKQNYPLNGECLTQYPTTATTSNNSFVYYGTSEEEFKTWYNNHTKPFRHRECMNETASSKHMVSITIYRSKPTKRPHHTNVAQNIPIYVYRKKFASFVLIQILY